MNDTKNRVQVYFKIINSGDKRCINCTKCVDSDRPEFSKCGAMCLN
jgi:polyferredoxin